MITIVAGSLWGPEYVSWSSTPNTRKAFSVTKHSRGYLYGSLSATPRLYGRMASTVQGRNSFITRRDEDDDDANTYRVCSLRAS